MAGTHCGGVLLGILFFNNKDLSFSQAGNAPCSGLSDRELASCISFHGDLPTIPPPGSCAGKPQNGCFNPYCFWDNSLGICKENPNGNSALDCSDRNSETGCTSGPDGDKCEWFLSRCVYRCSSFTSKTTCNSYSIFGFGKYCRFITPKCVWNNVNTTSTPDLDRNPVIAYGVFCSNFDTESSCITGIWDRVIICRWDNTKENSYCKANIGN